MSARIVGGWKRGGAINEPVSAVAAACRGRTEGARRADRRRQIRLDVPAAGADDAMAMLAEPDIEVVVEATCHAPAGLAHARRAIAEGKHIVMVNVEADVLAGPALARAAARVGVVYSPGQSLSLLLRKLLMRLPWPGSPPATAGANRGQVFSARRTCGGHGDHGAEAVGFDGSYTMVRRRPSTRRGTLKFSSRPTWIPLMRMAGSSPARLVPFGAAPHGLAGWCWRLWFPG